MVSFLLLAVDLTIFGTEPPEAMQHARNSYEMAKRGDLSGAGEEIRIAIRLAPENPLYVSALRGIGARQWEAGELVSARDNLAIAADARSADTKALAMIEEVSLELGASLAKEHRYKTGLILAQDTARRFPASPRAQQMLGLFLTRNQENPAAIAAYQKALSLSPESSDLNVGLGIAQTMAGLLADAVRTLDNGIRRWPGDAMHYQAYGVLLLRMANEGQGSEAEAQRMLNKALALNPALTEAHYQLGNLAMARGETAVALDHLTAALRNGDPSSKVHFALSRAYRAAGNRQDADKHAELFLEQKRREQRGESKQ